VRRKLVELNPRWVGHGGEGVTQHGQPVPRRERVAISFDCPCGRGERVCVEFSNPVDGGGPTRSDGHTWHRDGDTFETLSLTPSLQRMDECRWHGYLTRGELIPC
jgi:hypothetical protein